MTTVAMDFHWLIERGQAVGHDPTVWWSGDPKIGWSGWTTDVWKAQRFPTKAEAEEAVILEYFHLSDTWRVVEHGFEVAA